MPEIKGCASFGKAEAKSRPEFIKIGALGMGGLFLPSLLQAEQAAGIKKNRTTR